MLPIKGKKILVTGGAGFIGSHLVEELLRQEAKVTVLARYTSSGRAGWVEYFPDCDKLIIIFGDIRDPDICQNAVNGNDYIFHLAAQIAIPYSYIAPRDFLTVNAIGTANILQAARQQKTKKILHVSTSEVYGTAQYVPIDEFHPQVAQSPYAASKIAADKIAESFFRSFETPVVTVRPFNCYGPRQSARAVIPTIILQALKGNIIKLGNIYTRRDMNYVGDIVSGMIKAVYTAGTEGRVFNLATGIDYSIEEIVNLTADIMGKNLKIKADRRRIRPDNSEAQRLQGESKLAKKLIGYKPQYQLRDGLVKNIEFFERNIDLYKREAYQL